MKMVNSRKLATMVVFNLGGAIDVLRTRSTWPGEVGKWIAITRAGHRDLVGPHRFDSVGIDDAHRAIETQRSRYRRI
jgi:hypothetical protein